MPVGRTIINGEVVSVETIQLSKEQPEKDVQTELPK